MTNRKRDSKSIIDKKQKKYEIATFSTFDALNKRQNKKKTEKIAIHKMTKQWYRIEKISFDINCQFHNKNEILRPKTEQQQQQTVHYIRQAMYPSAQSRFVANQSTKPHTHIWFKSVSVTRIWSATEPHFPVWENSCSQER